MATAPWSTTAAGPARFRAPGDVISLDWAFGGGYLEVGYAGSEGHSWWSGASNRVTGGLWDPTPIDENTTGTSPSVTGALRIYPRHFLAALFCQIGHPETCTAGLAKS